MRLIDAETLEYHKQLECMGNGQYEDVKVVYEWEIDNAPTINAEPKHGEWIKFEDYLPKCKQCVLFLERVNGGQEYHIGIGVFYGLDDNPYVKGIQDNVVMTNRQWHVKDSRIIAWYPLPPFELEKASAPIYGIKDGIILE